MHSLCSPLLQQNQYKMFQPYFVHDIIYKPSACTLSQDKSNLPISSVIQDDSEERTVNNADVS